MAYVIFSDNRLRMKLNSHTAHLRSQTKNQAHSRPSPSALGMCFEKNRIVCLCFVRFVSLGITYIYILLHLFITLIHPLTNLPMHSLSFELGQTDPEQWSGISCACCWKASHHRSCFTYNAHINLVRAQMIFHSSYLALTPSPSPFSSLLIAFSFCPTFPSPSPAPQP